MNEMNIVKYKWTNEVESVFAKVDPWVEVPYVGHSLEMSYDTSTIQKYCAYEMYYI